MASAAQRGNGSGGGGGGGQADAQAGRRVGGPAVRWCGSTCFSGAMRASIKSSKQGAPWNLLHIVEARLS